MVLINSIQSTTYYPTKCHAQKVAMMNQAAEIDGWEYRAVSGYRPGSYVVEVLYESGFIVGTR